MIKQSAILVGVLLVLAISMFIIRKNSVSSGNPKLPLNDSFEYPFLGSVRCHSKVEEVVLLNKEGKTTPMQVKTSYNENGHFLRAEFTKANSRGQEFPVREQESFLAQGLQKIDGLPSDPPKLDAQRVLNHLNRVASGPRNSILGGATKMNVTRVILKDAYTAQQTVYIANLWEIDDDFFRGIGKSRYVLDEDGKVLFFDNVL